MPRSSSIDAPPPAPPSHDNSQHVLAIVRRCDGDRDDRGDRKQDLQRRVLEAFGKTSELPCDVWRSERGGVLLVSNYPDCILENEGWCVLCAGFCYRHGEAFDDGSFENKSHAASEDDEKASFARTLLDFCERHGGGTDRGGGDADREESSSVEELIGRRLKHCSGHFSAYVVRKGGGNDDPPKFWAWNDPFGFMPVYYSHVGNDCVISSRWDCLVPNLPSLRLDWDIVAEYIALGTTLGGGGNENEIESFDRTFVRGIRNLGPGCFIRLVPSCEEMQLNINRYIKCYGACEEALYGADLKSKQNIDSSEAIDEFSCAPFGKCLAGTIRGIQVMDKGKTPDHDGTYIDGETCQLLFHFIMDCVREAQRFATRAALTGGGDTRLILACLLLLRQQRQRTESEPNDRHEDPIVVFQTHSKQPTDWLIARHLARTFRLKHRRIHPVSTTTDGRPALWRRNEALLSNLHDQTPLRRKRNIFLFWKNEGGAETVEYALHGRFGTEFLGCLCFNKSPLDIRTDELEGFRPKAAALFRAAFGPSSDVRNPADTLRDRFRQLERDRATYEVAARKGKPIPPPGDDDPGTALDVAYAFQLQLYTRSTLSDIYKGLRGGSWFAIPTAQFTRNAIMPFLDNRLLQWMMCNVSVRKKEEPYRLYGHLYQSGVVPEPLRRVPSNNKLLCLHSEIPCARKRPEARARPHLPEFIIKGDERSQSNGTANSANQALEKKFHPVFWNGAIAIFENAPIVMDPTTIVGDSRPEVRAFLDRVDGDAKVACCLSGRLQSFLLWYERRFLVHENKL